jgi:hypothetical protein
VPLLVVLLAALLGCFSLPPSSGISYGDAAAARRSHRITIKVSNQSYIPKLLSKLSPSIGHQSCTRSVLFHGQLDHQGSTFPLTPIPQDYTPILPSMVPWNDMSCTHLPTSIRPKCRRGKSTNCHERFHWYGRVLLSIKFIQLPTRSAEATCRP